MTSNREELERIAATLDKFAFPKKFAIELCAECNLACSMCHHPFMKRPKVVLPFELWKKCGDEIAAVSPKTECWFSFCGEPFLEPELLVKCLQYGRSVGLQPMNINTYGMLVTPDLPDLPDAEFEAEVRAVMQDVLGLEKVPGEANFFDLGGTSLKALELCERLRLRLSISLQLVDVYRCPTLHALCRHLGAAAGEDAGIKRAQ